MTAAATHDLCSDFLAAVLAGDGTRARHLVDAALDRGLSPAEACLEVLQPALYAVGNLWAEGKVTIAYEHYATSVTQGILGTLGARMRVPPRGGRLAVLACSQGEQHALGVQMIGDFLEAEGWEVIQLGAALPGPDLAGLVANEQPDVVGLSSATAAMLPAARATLGLLGELDPRPLVVVGGRAWDELDDDEVVAAGADLRVRGPQELVATLRERLPPLPEDL